MLLARPSSANVGNKIDVPNVPIDELVSELHTVSRVGESISSIFRILVAQPPRRELL